jgi:hypothetical protein
MVFIHLRAIRLLGLSAAIALASSLACSDATAPSQTPSTFTIDAATGAYPPSPPTVHVTVSAITVDGTLITADPCFTVSGNASMSHDTLVVHVVGTDKNVGCVQSLGMWHYVLTVSPRPSGADAIRVEHDSGKGSSVVLEQPLP